MNGISETSFAGRSQAFVTTHWSSICAASDTKSPAQFRALEDLCRAYWLPLYAFARRSGRSPEDAGDLTQAFFARLLGRDTLAQAQRERGRFRTFLLAAFRNFLADERDRTQAQKRGGSAEFLEIDANAAEHQCHSELATSRPPDAVFDRQWALTILHRATEGLREEFAARGRERVFNQIKVFLVQDAKAEQFRIACTAAGITLSNGRVTLHRMRERFAALVRQEVAQTVRAQEDLDAELRYLLEVISV